MIKYPARKGGTLPAFQSFERPPRPPPNQTKPPMNSCCPASFDLSANRLRHLASALQTQRPASGPRPWRPSVDATETDASYELSVELPGVDPAKVKVLVRDGVLNLSGDRSAAPLPEGSKTHLREQALGPWERSFALPTDAAGDLVKAASKHGLLTISIPKRSEVQAREIPVQVG